LIAAILGCRVAAGQLQEAEPLLAAAIDMLSKQAEVGGGILAYAQQACSFKD
jgi:hypothetical protein